MAAGARLSALSAVGAAALLVAIIPVDGTAGLAYVTGALGVISLAMGLLAGSRALVGLGVAGLMTQITLSFLFEGATRAPVWLQVGMIALVVELSSVSFTWRRWPIDPPAELGRLAMVVAGLIAVTSLFEAVVSGVRAGGAPGRVVGVAGMIVAAGLVSQSIRRRVTTGSGS